MLSDLTDEEERAVKHGLSPVVWPVFESQVALALIVRVIIRRWAQVHQQACLNLLR